MAHKLLDIRYNKTTTFFVETTGRPSWWIHNKSGDPGKYLDCRKYQAFNNYLQYSWQIKIIKKSVYRKIVVAS